VHVIVHQVRCEVQCGSKKVVHRCRCRHRGGAEQLHSRHACAEVVVVLEQRGFIGAVVQWCRGDEVTRCRGTGTEVQISWRARC